MTVRLRHPTLPDGQFIDVDDMSVPHYRATGWEPVTGTDKPAEPEQPAAVSKRRGAAKRESD